MTLTISSIKERGLLLFETISGSKAYGTDHAVSDTDIRGVFALPKEEFYGLKYTPQVNDEKNDIVYYELGRFMELLSKSNPNILELLAAPEDCVLYRHPVFEKLKADLFLAKTCKNTFAGYAVAQIRKARGLNKKIVNPLPKELKTILDFCYIIKGHGSVALKTWLQGHRLVQENCGLINIPHMSNVYALFYDAEEKFGYKGIMQKPTANQVALSSIPKGEEKIAILSFNLNGYQAYCKQYREYWDWVEKRNKNRYANTISHGKNYDAKNMMHTFRLLDMAEEIAMLSKIVVRRPNRDFLLKIKSGHFAYEELVKMAEEKIESIESLFEKSKLPDKPNLENINRLLVEIRTELLSR